MPQLAWCWLFIFHTATLFICLSVLVLLYYFLLFRLLSLSKPPTSPTFCNPFTSHSSLCSHKLRPLSFLSPRPSLCSQGNGCACGMHTFVSYGFFVFCPAPLRCRLSVCEPVSQPGKSDLKIPNWLEGLGKVSSIHEDVNIWLEFESDLYILLCRWVCLCSYVWYLTQYLHSPFLLSAASQELTLKWKPLKWMGRKWNSKSGQWSERKISCLSLSNQCHDSSFGDVHIVNRNLYYFAAMSQEWFLLGFFFQMYIHVEFLELVFLSSPKLFSSPTAKQSKPLWKDSCFYVFNNTQHF